MSKEVKRGMFIQGQVWYFIIILEFCRSAYELVMSQVRLLQLSLSLISHRAM